MQLGEHHLDRRHALDRVDFHRDAAPVVLYGDRTVGVQDDGDALAVAAERLVGGVVDGFLDDVQRVVRARVHAGAMAHGLQPFEHGNGFGGVAHDSVDSDRPVRPKRQKAGTFRPALPTGAVKRG